MSSFLSVVSDVDRFPVRGCFIAVDRSTSVATALHMFQFRAWWDIWKSLPAHSVASCAILQHLVVAHKVEDGRCRSGTRGYCGGEDGIAVLQAVLYSFLVIRR